MPWSHSYKEMAHTLMGKWGQETAARGFSLRLGGWRHSHNKEVAEVCASQYRLRITAKDPKNYIKDQAVEILFEFATAARKLGLSTAALSPLPWKEIIEWWDGEDECTRGTW